MVILRGWAATLALPGPGVAPWEPARSLGGNCHAEGGCLRAKMLRGCVFGCAATSRDGLWISHVHYTLVYLTIKTYCLLEQATFSARCLSGGRVDG
ncbi:MAG: hypothetical protein AAGF95_20210 [Chloroflexota bacterium]